MQIAAHWDQLDVGNLVKNMAQVNRQIWKINKGTNKNKEGCRHLKSKMQDISKNYDEDEYDYSDDDDKQLLVVDKDFSQ